MSRESSQGRLKALACWAGKGLAGCETVRGTEFGLKELLKSEDKAWYKNAGVVVFFL